MERNFNQYYLKFDQAHVGIRAAVFVVILLAVFLIWYGPFFKRLSEDSSLTIEKLDELGKSLPKLEEEHQKLARELQLKLVSSGRQTTLSSHDPRVFLTNLLAANHNLTFIDLDGSSDENLVNKSKGTIYDGFMIRLRGNYPSVMGFFGDLEKQPFEIHWDKVDYRVLDYPEAEVTLHMRMLANG